VSGDDNYMADVFVFDIATKTTAFADLDDGDDPADFGRSYTSTISADGRFVAFVSDSFDLADFDKNVASYVFVRDRLKGTIALASITTGGLQGNDVSMNPSISADGRFVGFESVSDNLVSGDTNHHVDAFVRDRLLNTTTRVSLSKFGAQGNADSHSSQISADGHFVAFQSTATDLVFGGGSGIFVRAFAP